MAAEIIIYTNPRGQSVTTTYFIGDSLKGIPISTIFGTYCIPECKLNDQEEPLIRLSSWRNMPGVLCSPSIRHAKVFFHRPAALNKTTFAMSDEDEQSENTGGS